MSIQCTNIPLRLLAAIHERGDFSAYDIPSASFFERRRDRGTQGRTNLIKRVCGSSARPHNLKMGLPLNTQEQREATMQRKVLDRPCKRVGVRDLLAACTKFAMCEGGRKPGVKTRSPWSSTYSMLSHRQQERT